MVDSVDRMRRQHVLMQQASHTRSPLSNIAMPKMEDPAKLSSGHASKFVISHCTCLSNRQVVIYLPIDCHVFCSRL